MTSDLPSFQHYQQAFTAYIRDPLQQPRPKGVPAKRMDVYKEIVFNNLFESVSACFPVAQKILGKRAWLALVRRFLREHSANSPMFRQIPEEFVNYVTKINLSDETKLPHYLASLCHYEWVELLVSSMDETSNEVIRNIQHINPMVDLLAYQPVFTPTMQLLNYEYAVQRISPSYKPKEKVNTQLLVYRNAEDIVRFVELNPVTHRLIELLHDSTNTGEQALTMIANELNHPQPASVLQFGLEILNDLRDQGIILGVYS
jgi:hypothetical protein